jgi:glycosyltransferase involved in cell wall biosynthesis
MSVGKPLIATAVGTLPEIAPNANLAEPNSAASLAERIKTHDKTRRVFSDEAFLSAYLGAIA